MSLRKISTKQHPEASACSISGRNGAVPAKWLSPILDQVAAEIGDKALILKANVDDVQQQTVKFGVRNIPAIFILKDGTVVKQFNGVQDKATLIKAIEDAANA